MNKLRALTGVLGVLCVALGLLIDPEMAAKLVSGGKFESYWNSVLIQIFRVFIFIVGISLLLEFLLNRFISEKSNIPGGTAGLMLFGILVTISGVMLSASFIETKFSPLSTIEVIKYETAVSFQLFLVTSGLLIILFSLYRIRKMFLLHRKKYNITLFVVLGFIYILLVNNIYLSKKYPGNILFKPGEYSKVADLLLGHDILLSDFEPRPTLKVERKEIKRAKYPVIDVHFHFSSDFITDEDKRILEPENLIKAMDSVGVKMIVNLDGGADIEETLNSYQRKYPERFINFVPVGFGNLQADKWLLQRADKFEEKVKIGIRGMKVTKFIGLKALDASGRLLRSDDERIDPVWKRAGELGVPVLWHAADPTSFFQPINKYNERFVELGRYGDQWSFYGPKYPSRDTILWQRENVLKKHPNTIFIGAHMGACGDNLKYLGYLLDTYPNFYVDMSAAVNELGRQPYTARRFFIKYQDRILFGSDGGALFNVKGWSVEKFYQAYFEFLETENEYIPYPMQGAVNQGDWRVFGINLPDDVLEKIYYKNAEKLLSRNSEKSKVPIIQTASFNK